VRVASSGSDGAAGVKTGKDWRVFRDADSVNLLRELLKEHADQPPLPMYGKHSTRKTFGQRITAATF
jgi:hypothetical protein